MVAQQGLNPGEFAPYSGRLGDATYMTVRDGVVIVVGRTVLKGRLQLNKLQSHVKNNNGDVEKVSVALASVSMGKGVQPGTQWSERR